MNRTCEVLVHHQAEGRRMGDRPKDGMPAVQGQYTTALHAVDRSQVHTAGGKGANLGEMIQAGLPVPGGFVVTTGAYARFTAANQLDERIDRILEEMDGEDNASMQDAADAIWQMFGAAVIPADIAWDIQRAFAAMPGRTAAVRSSATAEDLPGMSFAGQYNTYLHVAGGDELQMAIKNCWASLWNYRALAYRVRWGIGSGNLAHAVVVQAMVDAEKAGILFTANPVNGRRDQMLLNASWGLGEAVVSGEVTPDQWVMETGSGRIIEERVARKQVMTVRKDRGTVTQDVPREHRDTVSLNREELESLRQLAVRTEEYFGCPQDIEWAVQGDRVYLVQTRPITSLYPLPQRRGDDDDLRIWLNFSLVSQSMHEPFTPMGASVFRKTFLAPAQLFESRIRDERDLWWLQCVGGRFFLDYTELLRNRRWWRRAIVNDFISDQEPLTAQCLLQWLERNEADVTSGRSRAIPWMLRKLIPCLKIAGPMITAGLWGTLFPLKAREKALNAWKRTVQRVRETAGQLHTTEEKLRFIEEMTGRYTLEGFSTLSYIAPSFSNVEKAEKIAAPYLDDHSDFRKVEQSLPHNATTNMGMELMQIAKELDQRNENAHLDQPEIQRFLECYGHRSNQEVDLGVARWDEEPEYVVSIVQSYIDNQSYEQGLNKFYNGQSEAREAIERIAEKLRNAGARRQAKKVVKLLNDYRSVFGLREESKFVLTQINHVFRQLLWEIGGELVEQGRLDHAGDVFFVHWEDLQSHGPLQGAAAANREEYHRFRSFTAPRVLSSTGEAVHAVPETSDGVLTGVPVSAGVYTGTARVLHSPEEGHRLRSGDILVTQGTNPAWTPLFLNLGAIVMETGGPISHGAVVAREYGVPAVVGVASAVDAIADGQRIRVNGESGQVQLLDADLP